ncbi:MAG: hypothetical protein F4X65_06420 [Chloroflexi bacterium]|nr:hypothetical protein [Chloroflexota bacterium]
MRKRSTALILAWVCSPLCDFYLGKVGYGIMKVVTLGGFGVWALIDAIRLTTMTEDNFNQLYNTPEVIAQREDAEREADRRATPEGALCFARGMNGQVALLEDRVRLERKGRWAFVTHGVRGAREILISEISSVEYRDAGSLVNGYILFIFRGGRDSRSSILGDDAIGHNENAVVFERKSQPAFDTLREMLNHRLDEYRQPQQVVVSAPQSSFDELKKLGDLREAGLISEDEFEREKGRLLG